jgi:hypothetical protein
MRLLLPLCAAVALLAGCGGDDERVVRVPPEAVAPSPTVPSTREPTDDEVRRALRLPGDVPLRADGDAPAPEEAVVRGWLEALSAGRVAQAARLFAVPSRFQNFSTVARIRTPRQALAVTASLPCGAEVTEIGGAEGFVIYEAELTDRPGGDCGQGVGGVVRGAVRVEDGRMTEWYRLPDRSQPRSGERVIPSGPII